MTAATAQSLNSLAARLTKPEDRETYAGLISYFESLPDHDELFRIVELLGLLSLLGQRLPDTLAEAMTQMRSLTDKAGEYYGEIDNRLEALPRQVTAAVDVSRMAKEMGELFRQQLAASSLESSAAHLRNSSAEMTALSGQIANCVKPATLEYKELANSIAAGVTKMIAASAQMQNQHVQPPVAVQSGAWLWHGLVMLVMLLIGGVGGIVFEKGKTVDVLTKLTNQSQCVQAPAVIRK